MRRRIVGMPLAVGLLLSLGGCPIIIGETTAVRLVNSASFPVRVRLFYHDDQLVLEELIDDFGQELSVTVQPGATFTFARDCDDLQAIIIEHAELNIIGGIGPEADTRVYRDGSDFGCGDTLVFTFTQGFLGTQLNIAFSRQ